jgi:cyclophilin family peptidyl-prolyl cis-trans isomerase
MFFNSVYASLTNRIKLSTVFFGLVFVIAQPAMATIVQFQTVMGDFSVNLYDKATPKTVENFLAYVKSGAYTNSIVHRTIPTFVVQGGGFKYEAKPPLIAIPQNAPVINEPIYANKRGTIAMAKISGDLNSATNQWFFNLADNSSSLDIKDQQFTVFGEVTGNGMAIIDAMAALSIFNGGIPFETLPLRNYKTTDGEPTDKNYVMILGIVVLDANVDSAAALTPAKTTYTPSTGGGSSSSGGGGSMGWASLLMLLALLGFSRSRR